MSEDTWGLVGAPMLLDRDGGAIFIYTPPSITSRTMSKAKDPLHAAKMFKNAQQDTSGRWCVFHFSSFDNPYINERALDEITEDMTALAFRQEIQAEDIEESPGALWTRKLINENRVTEHPDLVRIIVGVDPTGSLGNETGIVIAGVGTDGHGYIIDDKSLLGTPGEWADAVLTAYNHNKADMIVGETNYGGDMVEATIMQAANVSNQTCRYKNVHASRGKAVRAEPVVAQYEHSRIHHVGEFPYLEEEMVTWVPGISRNSPNRIDALVWAITELNTEIKKPAVMRYPPRTMEIKTRDFKRI
ncbi:DNA-packaging protein [candidate division WOR-3 bacterium]|nr:DNA-packaging protein [candidate division WOR-3 bacterium]